MLHHSLEIRAQKEGFCSDRIGILLRGFDGRIASDVTELVFKEKVDGEYSEPTCSLNPSDAQKLIDDLWDCGLRPSEGSGSAGSLRATQEHLRDMRAIVEKKLDINFNKNY